MTKKDVRDGEALVPCKQVGKAKLYWPHIDATLKAGDFVGRLRREEVEHRAELKEISEEEAKKFEGKVDSPGAPSIEIGGKQINKKREVSE
jgi:hypothetical protein